MATFSDLLPVTCFYQYQEKISKLNIVRIYSQLYVDKTKSPGSAKVTGWFG